MPPDNPQFSSKSLNNVMESPLQKLEQEIAKDYRSENAQSKASSDAASVYSFDSVSTSGRLLDRLDLEFEEYDEDFLRRRESYALIQSTGRLLDRLGLEEEGEFPSLPLALNHAGLPSTAGGDPRLRPVRASSAISLNRMRSTQSQRPPIRSLSSTSASNSNGRLPIHRVDSAHSRHFLEKQGASVDSFQADMKSSQNSLFTRIPNAQRTNSSASAVSAGSAASSNSSGSIDSAKSSNLIKMPGKFPDSGPEVSQKSAETEATQVESASGQNLPIAAMTLPKPSLDARIPSSSSQTSISSAESPIFNPNLNFNPTLENMVRQALLLRNQNDREASYKLQIAGNAPNHYPKAMFLYAMALLRGLGVKKNDNLCIKWLCRCILVSQIVETNPVDIPSLNNYVQRLHELQPQDLVKMVSKSITEQVDPFDLIDVFLAMSSSLISKIVSLNNKENNTIAAAYHRLGEAALLGAGLPAKEPLLALSFFSQSASMGYPLSMVKLGELWGSKSKHYKKDLHKSAAWLRLAELFGMKDIGNSWIYKAKYMTRPKK